MNPLKWARQSIRTKGSFQTLKIAANVVMDLHFDWRYGTDTLRWVGTAALEANTANQSHSAPYRATKVRPLLSLLRRLDLPRDSWFVDIGSGKGRVLLIASQYGFRKVVGIEFSKTLCAMARENVDIFCGKVPRTSPIEVVEADATTYQFHTDERVLFMYNPFDAHIMSHLVENIRKSLDESPRRIWVIYNTPQHHDVLKNAGFFKSDEFYEIGGNHFRVYSN
jgi:SAM-dependent methyltransferase